ncbi:MAG: AMP-binding protein [Actinobacteria bacterium]|nr:AMP-binding protein [Actinomycetota bacterium]MBU1944412.1 AMP-binding protein [Actinomycetota bacterium]MBU2688198.1 AMP-binding protein [Actinomycetota bacterium]
MNNIKVAADRSITFGNFMDRLAEVYGDKTCFHLDRPLDYSFMSGESQTFEQWREFVDRMANVFEKDLDVRKGDRVVVDMSNRIEIPFTCFALMKIGAVAVPINFMLTAKEIAYIADDAGAKLMVTDKPVFEVQMKEQSAVPSIERWAVWEKAEQLPGEFVEIKPLIEKAPPTYPPQEKDPDELVGIFYTSGTTGFPKGAMMTSRSLLTAQRLTAAIIPTTSKDIGVMALPLAHLFGFGLTLISLSGGLTGYFVRSFDPHRIMDAIQKSRATIFVGVPAMYTMMLEAGLDEHDLSSVRIWGSSADAMPDEIAKEFKKRGRLRLGPLDLDSIFLDAYGMVELSSLACLKMPLPGIKFPPKCVGFPMPPIRTRILDEQGGRVRRGEVGELAVKGPCVMKGYWNKPEETAEQMVEGWFRTGDMARKDRFGRIYFADRKKDVVKSGGYSVFSVEVEQEILENPAVADVAIVGIPHPTKKEAPVAICVLEEGSTVTEEELHAWCRENIARYKSPRRVIIISMEEMPRTPTMKVLKRELRQTYGDLFEGEE